MRLRLVESAFSHPDYLFELKHDGFRAVTYIQKGKCKFVSRNSTVLRFPSLSKNLAKLAVREAIIDGEIVSLDPNGVSRFNELLQDRRGAVLYAFDLLWLDGVDLRHQPLIKRKKCLETLVRKSGLRIKYTQHVEQNGKWFFANICRCDLEGVVAKPKLGIYNGDDNSWLEIRNPNYTQAEGRHELLTLLLSAPRKARSWRR